MPKKCPAYDCCPVRLHYEMMSGGKEALKKHCRGDYKKCGRYLLEDRNRMIPKKKPRKPKKLNTGQDKRKYSK